MSDTPTARIAACLDRPGMTIKLLAHAAEVHRNTIEGYDKPGWNPTKNKLDKIMAAVDRIEGALP
jgi:lambda repressor-like predicted transcriptional regulator